MPGMPAIPGTAAPAAPAGQPDPPAPAVPTHPTGATNATAPIDPQAAGLTNSLAFRLANSCIARAVAAPAGAPSPCAAAPAAPTAAARARPAQPAVTAVAIRQVVQRYMQRLPLPAPGIHLNPSRPAIVNFPTIVNADAPPASNFVVSQPGFPRIDVAASCQWRWHFGDGAVTATDWPGRPYDGTLPADDPQHYLLHTYRDPGTLTVTVTAVWSATYTVAGLPGTTAMAGTVSRASSATLPVREYAANLVP